MVTLSGSGLSFFFGIVAVVLEIVLICIIFSLPGRFREQTEHIDKRMDAIEEKLNQLLAEEKGLDGSSEDHQGACKDNEDCHEHRT